MGMNVGQAVSELRRMTVTELRRKYCDVFGEQTRSYHKDFLVRRIAWRMQANEEGGLPERARLRALEIANDADPTFPPPMISSFEEYRHPWSTNVSALPMPGGHHD